MYRFKLSLMHISIVSIVLVAFNNCGGPFEPTASLDIGSQATDEIPPPEEPEVPEESEIPDDGPTSPAELAALFSDSFESGDLSTQNAEFRWTSGGGERPVVSTDIARTGAYSLKFTMEGVPADDDSFSEQRFRFTRQHSQLYLTWYQYFPDGTEGLGPKYVHRGDRPGNNKFLRLWDENYNDYNVKVGFSTLPRENGDSVLITEYGTGSGVGSGGSTGDGPRAFAPEFITDANRGRWVHFAAYVKLATAGNNDGAAQIWIDGVNAATLTDIPLYPESGIGNYIQNGYLMGWANSGFDQTSFTYIDDIEIWGVGP